MSAAGAAIGIGGAVVGAMYNEASQRAAEKRSVRFTKELADYNYGLQRRAEREAPMNQKLGLMNAGLSPALASEGKFSAPVGNAPTPPQTQGQKLDPMLAADLTTKQLQNELLKEEVRGKDIDNTRKEDENKTYDLNVRNYIDEQLSRSDLSESERAMFEAMKENSHDYTKGGYDALNAWIEFKPKVAEMVTKKADAEFRSEILRIQKKEGVSESIAKMPTAQLQQLVTLTAKARAEIQLAASQAALNEVKSNEARANAAKLIAEAQSIYHGDIAALVANGDFKSLVAIYADKAISSAIDVVGVAGKAKAAGRLTKGFKDSLDKALKSSQKFSAPSVKHTETWTDKRGHLHSKTSRK